MSRHRWPVLTALVFLPLSVTEIRAEVDLRPPMQCVVAFADQLARRGSETPNDIAISAISLCGKYIEAVVQAQCAEASACTPQMALRFREIGRRHLYEAAITQVTLARAARN